MAGLGVNSRVASIVVFGLVAVGARTAAARDDERVRVTFVPARAGFEMRIRDVEGRSPELACASTCVARLRPGSFYVGVLEGTRVTWESIVIDQPGRVLVTPPDRAARDLGGGLMGIGAGLLAASAFLLWEQNRCTKSDWRREDCSEPADSVAPAGVPLGIVLGVVGGFAFASGRRSSLTFTRAARPPVRLEPTVQVGVGRGSITSLGATVRF